MSFNINEIVSYINSGGGLMKPNKFSVMITPPAWSTDTNAARLIQMLTDSCQMPGITFDTNKVRNLGYGPTFELPHTQVYTNISTNIMLDNNGTILNFFLQWMQNIVNINPDGAPATSGYNGARMYAVQYPANYVTTIMIMLYDPEAGTIVSYTLNDAYPLRIGQPTLDWNDNNKVLKLEVEFAFRSWSSTAFLANSQTLSNSISSFDPFGYTSSGSLYDTSTYSYMSLNEILTNTAVSLINNTNNYSSNLLNIFN